MNSNDDEKLEIQHIELAGTRPTMLPAWILGEVPIELGCFIIVVGGYCMIIFGVQYALWAPMLWFLCSKLISRDYHAITKFILWVRFTNVSSRADMERHGGSSETPMPVISERPKGMATHAL